MSKQKDFQVGDIIIRFGQVHQISEIKEKVRQGKKQMLLFYEHYFKNKRNRSLKLSIPLANIQVANIRKPVSKKYILEIFEKFLPEFKLEKVNINAAKAMVNTDDLKETFKMLKNLFAEKINPQKKFPLSKKEVFLKLMKRTAGEVAYIFKLDLEAAKKKIEQALKKSL